MRNLRREPLVNESPLMVSPSLAAAIGVNQAIVVQQIWYWMESNREQQSKRHFHDGRWWVYNTYQDWCKTNFPWLEPRGLQNILIKLQDMGIIDAAQGLEDPLHREKWYTVNKAKVDEVLSIYLANPVENGKKKPGKARPKSDKNADLGQGALNASSLGDVHLMHDASPHLMHQQYTETTTETTLLNDSAAENATDHQDHDAPYIVGGKNLNARKPQNDSQAKDTPVDASMDDGQEKDLPSTKLPPHKAYFTVVSKAFKQTDDEKSEFVGRLISWFKGTCKSKKPDQWTTTMPVERPALPEEIIGLTLWYAENYKKTWDERKQLPTTLSLLRMRLDEFRGSPRYDKTMQDAKARYAALVSGTPAPASAAKDEQQRRVDAQTAYNRANRALVFGEQK